MKALRKPILLIGFILLINGIIGTSLYAHSADYPTTAMDNTPTAEQRAKFTEHMHEREARLHDELKLTPAQEPAWRTYVAQSKPPFAEPGMRPPGKEALSQLTTPEMLQQRIEFMRKMEAHLTRHANALKAFYATLTPEQQKILDDHYRHEHHDHFNHGHGGMGMSGGDKG